MLKYLPCKFEEGGGRQCEREEAHDDDNHFWSMHTIMHERAGNGYACEAIDHPVTVEVAQALLAVLVPEGEISVGDRVSIPDDGEGVGDGDGTETGVVISVAPGGFLIRPDTGEFAGSLTGLWYHTDEVSLLDGEG